MGKGKKDDHQLDIGPMGMGECVAALVVSSCALPRAATLFVLFFLSGLRESYNYDCCIKQKREINATSSEKKSAHRCIY